MKKVILASTSPRRKELFAKLGIPFTVVAPNFEEEMTLKLPPEKLVQHLALGKAQSIAPRFPNAIIVSSDSIVVFRGRILGKPKTTAKAALMLQALQNKRNTVMSGVAVLNTGTGKTTTFVDRADVYFTPMSQKDISWYIHTGEPLDRAGAFAIQGIGMQFIKRIDGDLSTIIGLPLPRLRKHLQKIGAYGR
jgi:septum formation protein